MFCYKCGTKIPEGVAFCHKCGAKMPDGNVSEKIVNIPSTKQNNQDDVLHQEGVIEQDQNLESSSVIKDDVKDSADNDISENQNASNISAESDRAWKNDNSSQYDKDADMQSPQTGSENDENKYGDNIKSYYCEQFDRIARGEKAKFNWAALLFGGCNQLYNGCTKVFCRTYLPLLAVGIVINLITILATIHFNFTLVFIMSSLGGIWGFCYLGLSFLNGFKFNTWFYQDFISNPDKKRSKKGLGVFIVSAIVVCAVMCTLPFILKSSSDDLESLDLIGERNEGVELSEIYTNKEDIMVPSDESGQKMNSLNTEFSEETLDDIPFGYEGDETDYREAYSSKVLELSEEDDSLQFALIDLVDNGVPELVADNPGYYVSTFTWADGEAVTLMDQWGYGIGGNNGYKYLPGGNVIRNCNMDYAGAVVYESYMTVNDACEIVPLDEGFSIWFFRDANENGWPDEDEYSEEPIYYYGDTEISEEDYASHRISGDFEWITGDLSAGEILLQLEGNDMSSGYASYESLTGYQEPIENYLELAGAYVGNTSQATLSLSIYSSQEEGELEIGYVEIYTGNGQYYFGVVVPAGENVYKVATDTGEDVLLIETAFSEEITLQLYVDGQYLEEYQMTEHYES